MGFGSLGWPGSGGVADPNAIYRNNTQPPAVNISWNSKKLTSLANGTAANDAVNLSQLQALSPTSITVAAAQALVNTSTVEVGHWYIITDSTQALNAADRIWVQGVKINEFSNVGYYVDSVNDQVNEVIYLIDDTPTDLLIFRRDNHGNEVWDIGNFGTMSQFPWSSPNCNSNKIRGGMNAIVWGNNPLVGNEIYDATTIHNGGFTTSVYCVYNRIGANTNVQIGANNTNVESNRIGANSNLAVAKTIIDCIIGEGCTIDDGGFTIQGCIFLNGATYTATADISNAIISGSGIVIYSGGDMAITSGRKVDITPGANFDINFLYSGTGKLNIGAAILGALPVYADIAAATGAGLGSGRWFATTTTGVIVQIP